MNFLLIVLLLISSLRSEPLFVKEFHELVSKQEEIEYINKYTNSNNVTVAGYVTCVKIRQAKYKLVPWVKLAIFNKEKLKLELLIKRSPNNLHLRYLRLVVQESIPEILNYKSNIKNDKLFIENFLSVCDTTDYLDKYILKNTSL